MREIIFRGKSIENGEWVTGYYCNCSLPSGEKKKTGHYILEYPDKYHEIYTETLKLKHLSNLLGLQMIKKSEKEWVLQAKTMLDGLQSSKGSEAEGVTLFL